MHRVLLFADELGQGREYVVILDQDCAEEAADHARPGFKLSTEVEVDADLHMFPLGDVLMKDY